MKLKKLLLATLLFATFTSTLTAQEYETAIGIRLGYDNGISGRHFFMPFHAVEGIVSFSPNSFKITGLYQFQQIFLEFDNLDWYVGAGMHIGSLTRSRQQALGANHAFLLGFDLIAGVEYAFPTLPFALSLDWKPSFSITQRTNDWFYGFGLTLRYTFR